MCTKRQITGQAAVNWNYYGLHQRWLGASSWSESTAPGHALWRRIFHYYTRCEFSVLVLLLFFACCAAEIWNLNSPPRVTYKERQAREKVEINFTKKLFIPCQAVKFLKIPSSTKISLRFFICHTFAQVVKQRRGKEEEVKNLHHDDCEMMMRIFNFPCRI